MKQAVAGTWVETRIVYALCIMLKWFDGRNGFGPALHKVTRVGQPVVQRERGLMGESDNKYCCGPMLSKEAAH